MVELLKEDVLLANRPPLDIVRRLGLLLAVFPESHQGSVKAMFLILIVAEAAKGPIDVALLHSITVRVHLVVVLPCLIGLLLEVDVFFLSFILLFFDLIYLLGI